MDGVCDGEVYIFRSLCVFWDPALIPWTRRHSFIRWMVGGGGGSVQTVCNSKVGFIKHQSSPH